jgi:hypothetical protein
MPRFLFAGHGFARNGLIVSTRVGGSYFLDGNAELEWSAVLFNLNPGAPPMKKQILQVSPFQSAKVMAFIYLVTAIPIALLMAIPAMLGSASVSLVILILMPILYMGAGFLGTLLGAWIYNLVAARVGGLEFTTAEVASAGQS